MPTTADPRSDLGAHEATRPGRAGLDVRAKILYLVAVGVVAFAVSSPWALLGLLVLQPLLWLVCGYAPRELARPCRRLLPFGVLLVATALLVDRDWNAVLDGGVIPALRLFAIVLASHLVHRSAGHSGFAEGLARLGCPTAIGVSLEATLSLLSGAEQRRPGTARSTAWKERRRVLGDVLRGRIGFLVDAFQEALERARSGIEPFRASLGNERLHDLAVISAVAFVSASVRLVRVAPGLPIAPGHKSLILIPLYVVAGAMTRSRWGATQAGFVMGLTALLTGDGRFGVFEILKHVTPGTAIDAVLPRLQRRGGVGRGGYAFLGFLAGVSRFSTIVAVALFVGAPSGFFALLAPVGIAHATFGALSGLVTVPLLRALNSGAGGESRRVAAGSGR